MNRTVDECIDAFLRRYPRYLEPAAATSQCRIATTDLITELEAARIVWVGEPRTSFRSPQPRAVASTEHALAALASGGFLDVTRRQYDSDADVPTFSESPDVFVGRVS